MKVERVRVGDVLVPARDPVGPEPTDEYVAIGVRSFGKGIFHYEPSPGAKLGSLRFFDVQPGRLVVSNIKGWEGAIAVSSAADAGCIASNRFLQYVPRDGRIDVRWARWFLLGEQGIELVQRASPGSADRNRTLAIERFEALEIPLPPIDEQRRVAQRLERVAESMSRVEPHHIQRRNHVLGLIESEVGRCFEQLEAPPIELGKHIEIVSGATPDTANPLYWHGDIPWVTPTDLGALHGRELADSARRITTAGYESCSARLVQPGAVIMSSRAPIGHLAIAAVPLCTSQGCKSFLTYADMSPDFLYWALRAAMPRIRAAGSGTTFEEVSTTKLRGIQVPLPRADEQAELVQHLDRVEAQVFTVLSHLVTQSQRMRAVLSAALNAAFAGLS